MQKMFLNLSPHSAHLVFTQIIQVNHPCLWFFFFLILQTQSPSSSTGNLWIKKYTFSLFLPEYPRWSRITSNLTCLSNVKSKTYITLVYHLPSANFRTVLIAILKDDDVFWVSHRNNTFSLEICGILTMPSTLRLHGLMIPSVRQVLRELQKQRWGWSAEGATRFLQRWN